MPLNLKANDGCCEEASTLSRDFYIPCNQPATKIVGWLGRNDKPIRMCEACAYHNVRNRGGYVVRVIEEPSTRETELIFVQGGKLEAKLRMVVLEREGTARLVKDIIEGDARFVIGKLLEVLELDDKMALRKKR